MKTRSIDVDWWDAKNNQIKCYFIQSYLLSDRQSDFVKKRYCTTIVTNVSENFNLNLASVLDIFSSLGL